MPTSISNYWRVARAPRYSLTFALPLLVAYEVLAFSLSHAEVTGVRNGADVLLKSLFLAMGGHDGLMVFGALLVGGGAWLVWLDYRRSRTIDLRVFGPMMAESVVYALAFGLVTSTLTGLLLPTLSTSLATGSAGGWTLPTQLMISLGAGIYEELLFRVILVSGLAWVARKVLSLSVTASGVLAVVLGALIFSAFHYIGPYGDRLQLGSFTFRAVAGVLFSGLYLLRGFGITAWAHALYDVFLALR
jgi:hypothetical protein